MLHFAAPTNSAVSARSLVAAAFAILVSASGAGCQAVATSPSGRATDTDTSARPAAYSTIGLRLSVATAPNIGRLGDYYRARPGFVAEVETPFERGVIGFTFGRIPFQRTPLNANEDFHGEIIGVDWHTRPVHLNRILSSIGARVSTFRMNFVDTLSSAGVNNEEELSIGLVGRAAVPLTSNIAVVASAGYARVFLHVPEYITTVSIGVGVTRGMPRRIQEILR